MNSEFDLLPAQASTIAPRVDALFFTLLGITVFFSTLIAGLIIFLSIRYRRNSKVSRVRHAGTHTMMEIAWIVGPLVICICLFVWGARLYFTMVRAPHGAIEIAVTGKQWMWKFQHPQGNREINELHVPRDKPVKLTMISEDVIHDLFFPAFRVKADVLPGRYTTLWFEATRTGEYHIFCAEYCGTWHSHMRGKVVVMEPADYEAWLSGNLNQRPPAEMGKLLVARMGCNNCHQGGGGQSRAPPFEGLFGKPVTLADGRMVTADENYVRESVLEPQAKVVAGFKPIMPSFQGQITEEGLTQIVAYLRTLSSGDAAQGPAKAP